MCTVLLDISAAPYKLQRMSFFRNSKALGVFSHSIDLSRFRSRFRGGSGGGCGARSGAGCGAGSGRAGSGVVPEQVPEEVRSGFVKRCLKLDGSRHIFSRTQNMFPAFRDFPWGLSSTERSRADDACMMSLLQCNCGPASAKASTPMYNNSMVREVLYPSAS